MLESLRAYAGSLWKDLVARMSSVASLLFTGGATYSHHFEGILGVQNAQKYWWLAAAASGILASYRVWQKEHLKVLSQQPSFNINPEHVNWWFQADHNETMMIVAVSLTNLGAPSVVSNWHGNLIVGGIKEELKPIHITDRWLIPSPVQGKEPVVIFPENQITTKTAEGFVARGEGRNGRLFLATRGDKRKLLESLNWTLEVFCNDFLGNQFRGFFQPHPRLVDESRTYPGERHLNTQELKEVLKPHETKIPRRSRSPKKV